MIRRIPLRLMAAWWRLSRGTTLGAQGVVVDEEGKVLLVRHGYRRGWHFPGGGVEWGETVEGALARELFEETGVLVRSRPKFHGLFANFTSLPSDHIALFVVDDWERPQIPAPSYEIRESKFFRTDALPPDAVPAVSRRIAEIFAGVARDPHW